MSFNKSGNFGVAPDKVFKGSNNPQRTPRIKDLQFTKNSFING